MACNRRSCAILATIALLSSGVSHAQLYGVATLSSYHFDRSKPYNEKNLGLGLEYHVTEELWLSSGFYKNSYYRSSSYWMVNWMPASAGDFRFGAAVGFLTGYESRPSPMVIPTVAYHYKRVGFNLGVTPAALALQVKYSFE